MRVQLNGEEREVPSGISLIELLKTLDLPASRVAIERNREVVPRNMFGEVVLKEGDQLEVVRFVGGG